MNGKPSSGAFKLIKSSFTALLAKEFRDKVVAEVAAGRMKVVCNGVTSKILPGLNDDYVRRFNKTPVGPHPVASFEVIIDSF